jgi:magnesium chelatase family protein
MSLAIVHTRAQVGLDAPAVTVEVHITGGLPALSIVGLPEAEVKESKDRVRSAIINSRFEFPARRIKSLFRSTIYCHKASRMSLHGDKGRLL